MSVEAQRLAAFDKIADAVVRNGNDDAGWSVLDSGDFPTDPVVAFWPGSPEARSKLRMVTTTPLSDEEYETTVITLTHFGETLVPSSSISKKTSLRIVFIDGRKITKKSEEKTHEIPDHSSPIAVDTFLKQMNAIIDPNFSESTVVLPRPVSR